MSLSPVTSQLQILRYQGPLCCQCSVKGPWRDGGLMPTPASVEKEQD